MLVTWSWARWSRLIMYFLSSKDHKALFPIKKRARRRSLKGSLIFDHPKLYRYRLRKKLRTFPGYFFSVFITTICKQVFKSHFYSKLVLQKIQNLVRSSIPSILRAFFEFSNLSKTPKIIFFGQNFFLADVLQYGEHF